MLGKGLKMKDDDSDLIIKDRTLDYRKEKNRTIEQFEENLRTGLTIEHKYSRIFISMLHWLIDSKNPIDFVLSATGNWEQVGSIKYNAVGKSTQTRPDLFIKVKDKSIAVEIQAYTPKYGSDFRIKEHKIKYLNKFESCINNKSFLLHLNNDKPYLLDIDFINKQIKEKTIVFIQNDLKWGGKPVYLCKMEETLVPIKSLNCNTYKSLCDWLVN